ncbi:hypothetical protein [Nocardia sp. NPDC050175]|uniref:hypothetical protein n=1 Tax=Nocardia sp. NPDC050175 TaxID=3364317 RepID=UPI00378FB5FE
MREPDNKDPDKYDPGYDDPEATKVIAIPAGIHEDQHSPDEPNAFDDPDDVSEGDVPGEDAAPGEEAVSPLVRRWRRVSDYVTAGDVRRHLPYAAAAAVVMIAVITVVIVTATNPKKTGEVTDAASSSDASPGTQSFDDITQLLQGGLASTTTPLETSFPTTVSETPGDVPPPGDIPSVEPVGGDQSVTPATVTVTDSAPIENVSGDPVTTETGVTTETVAPSTITETPTASPGFSIDGSISVQASRQPSTQVPGGGPSTVTVVVPAGTTPPQPSTVTVIVPATTTPPRPSTSKPTGCPTATTPTKTTTTTPSPTTTTRAPSTTSPQRTTTPPSTSKKPTATTPTTTARSCK